MKKLPAFLAAIALVVAAAVSLSFSVVPAFADASTTVSVAPFFDTVGGQVVVFITMLAMGAITYVAIAAARFLKKKTGLDLEAAALNAIAAHRATIETAVTNAAGLLVAKVGSKAEALKVDVHSAEVKAVVDYAIARAPDAIAKFGLDGKSLAEKILAKVPQLPADTAPPAAPAP